MGRTGFRAVLYSPGVAGFGHFRRNLLLARRFAAAYPDAAFLMLTEARQAGGLGLPDNVDCLSLPALRQDQDGARRSGSPLQLSDVQTLRAAVLEAALLRFEPDVALVDHLPTGVLGELHPSLPRLRAEFGTRLVLGLPDILGESAAVQADWAGGGHAQLIRELYDAVWIYGDPWVYDALTEYALPADIAARAEYTGYLNPAYEREHAPLENADCLATQLFQQERVVLCLPAEGPEGVRLAEAFLASELPAGTTGVLLADPAMASSVRERLVAQVAARRGRFRVLGMIAEPARLLAHAERVITMGGYDRVTEAVALGKQTLVVPRTHSGREQWIRARRFNELGLLDLLHPDHLSPAALGGWLQRSRVPGRFARRALDMHGLDRAVRLLELVLTDRWSDPAAHGRRRVREGGLAIA